ncbi:hypothetical protein CE91St41_02160 [Oscillospiraceae bacterium]|nr:hypothetical protein CE91St40_02160 [Oscillospiraceae bacterium]BDF73327.1 hypothetical protein CE91St41_02160 [Oscillospiraceae bacterium]
MEKSTRRHDYLLIAFGVSLLPLLLVWFSSGSGAQYRGAGLALGNPLALAAMGVYLLSQVGLERFRFRRSLGICCLLLLFALHFYWLLSWPGGGLSAVRPGFLISMAAQAANLVFSAFCAAVGELPTCPAEAA